MNHISNLYYRFNHHFKKVLLACSALIALALFINYIYYNVATNPKSHAAIGATVHLSFSPQSVIASPSATFSTTLQAQMVEGTTSIQGYAFHLKFNNAKLKVTNILYNNAFATASAQLGDTNSNLDAVNTIGDIHLVGEVPSAVGTILTADPTAVATITFQSQDAGSYTIPFETIATESTDAINSTNDAFYAIQADNSILPLPIGISPMLINPTAAGPAPTCDLTSSVPSPQNPTSDIVFFGTPTDQGGGIYNGARFEVDDGTGNNFQLLDTACDFNDGNVSPPWNCTWNSAVNRQPGTHTIRMTVQDASGVNTNSCQTSFTLDNSAPVGNVVSTIKLRFQGITQPNPRTSAMNVSIGLGNPSLTQTLYETVPFTRQLDGTWLGQTTYSLDSNLLGDNHFTFYVKGPYHLQKRICDNAPTEGTDGTYHCDQGAITLTSGGNNLDFTGVKMLVGDLPAQDGIIDSYDLSLVRQNLGLSTPEAVAAADVNLDGVVDSQDYSLIIAALSIRTDDGSTPPTGLNTTIFPTSLTPTPQVTFDETATPTPVGATGDLLRDGTVYPLYISTYLGQNCLSFYPDSGTIPQLSFGLLGATASHSNVPYDIGGMTPALLVGQINVNDLLSQDLHAGQLPQFSSSASVNVSGNHIAYSSALSSADFLQMQWCTSGSGCSGVDPGLENQKFIELSSLAVACE